MHCFFLALLLRLRPTPAPSDQSPQCSISSQKHDRKSYCLEGIIISLGGGGGFIYVANQPHQRSLPFCFLYSSKQRGQLSDLWLAARFVVISEPKLISFSASQSLWAAGSVSNQLMSPRSIFSNGPLALFFAPVCSPTDISLKQLNPSTYMYFLICWYWLIVHNTFSFSEICSK